MFVVRDGGESKNDGISSLAFEISWNITHHGGKYYCGGNFVLHVSSFGWLDFIIDTRKGIYLPFDPDLTSTNAITKHSLAFVPDSAMFESKIMLVKRFKDMSDS